MTNAGDVSRVEAPVTLKAYMLCAFAAFGGILFGYDSGYISGCIAMDQFKLHFGSPGSTSPDAYEGYMYSTTDKSLIVSILSAGTFFGAIFAGSLADWLGRRSVIILGSLVFMIGVVVQISSSVIGQLVGGRIIAGLGVGFVSAIIILYMSEIAPKAVRGTMVSGYQFAVTIGLLLASVVNESTKGRKDTGAYRIPIGIQFLWGIILIGGLLFLPESPRWFVKQGKIDKAAHALARLRGQSEDSAYIQDEINELVANYEYEINHMSGAWKDCFTGGWSRHGNFRRVMIGILMQMMQQWTGVNFIFYYGPTFFKQVGLNNAFIISLITTIVNVCSTPLSFWTIERFGRRAILMYGAIGMLICEFIVAIVGTAVPGSHAAGLVLIVFVCIYVGLFASTWGPAAWVVIGEIFPLPIRAKGVALATASNWFWNFVIGYVTPYMVDADEGNLGAKVFFLWGSTCTMCVLFTYFLVPETKGLSLEQVDKMMEESSPRTSSRWVPHETFAAQMDAEKGVVSSHVEHQEVQTKEAAVDV